MCDNKIIIQYNSDFDFITCKTPNECIRLYNGLQQATDPKNKYIIYSGFISDSHKTWLYNQLEEKLDGIEHNFIKLVDKTIYIHVTII